MSNPVWWYFNLDVMVAKQSKMEIRKSIRLSLRKFHYATLQILGVSKPLDNVIKCDHPCPPSIKQGCSEAIHPLVIDWLQRKKHRFGQPVIRFFQPTVDIHGAIPPPLSTLHYLSDFIQPAPPLPFSL